MEGKGGRKEKMQFNKRELRDTVQRNKALWLAYVICTKRAIRKRLQTSLSIGRNTCKKQNKF